ncbi:MAG: hypothetical protein B7X02_01420, partial [Rhodospirillales bacterium 12-54-5]
SIAASQSAATVAPQQVAAAPVTEGNANTKTSVQAVSASDRAAPAASAKPAEEPATDATNATATKVGSDAFSSLLAQEISSQPKTNSAPTSGVSHTNLSAPVPVTEQVHVAVNHAVKEGIGQITIQLDPAELGRVEVKLHTGNDGQTQVSFLVDKPSTLDSLTRGAHGLERSLQEAGVKTDAGNMQFNLRQQPQTFNTGTGTDGGQKQSQPHANIEPVMKNSTADATALAAVSRSYSLNLQGNLDIHA